MELMWQCLGVLLLGFHLHGTWRVCAAPEAQYTRPYRPPTLGFDNKVNDVVPTQPRSTFSHAVFSPHHSKPGVVLPQLLPFTQKDAFPFRPRFQSTAAMQQPLTDRDIPMDSNRRVPDFLKNRKSLKKSRDLAADDAQYLMVMSKPQRPPESMQDYALLEGADDIPSKLQPETSEDLNKASESSRVSGTEPIPISRSNSNISSTTPSSPILDQVPLTPVIKLPRLSRKGKNTITKQNLREHRERKRSPQQPDLHYVPSFRRRQVGVSSSSHLSNHLSGNAYGGQRYHGFPIPEIPPHQHYGGVNSLVGYGLQYPSVPVTILPYGANHVPALYGGQISQLPVTYRIPMYTTATSLTPAPTYGIPAFSPFQDTPLLPHYRTPEVQQVVQPLVAVSYMAGNPMVPNYQPYPMSTPYMPVVTTHPGYHQFQNSNHRFPIYEDVIQKNGTIVYSDSPEEENIKSFIEKQQQPVKGPFTPVFMKQQPASYQHPLSIMTRLQDDINLPPIYRPFIEGNAPFSGGFTPVAVFAQAHSFQDGYGRPIQPLAHTDSKENDSKLENGKHHEVSTQQSDEQSSQPIDILMTESPENAKSPEDSSGNDRGRRVAQFPQNRTFVVLDPKSSALVDEKHAVTPVIKVVEAQDRSFDDTPSQLQTDKPPRKISLVWGHFFSTDNSKPSNHQTLHKDNNIYGFSINDPALIARLKRLKSPAVIRTKPKKPNKPKSSSTCIGLFGEAIPGCKTRQRTKNVKKKPKKNSAFEYLDIIKGGVFTSPKQRFTDRVSHLVPQVEHTYYPIVPPNTITLSQVEQSILKLNRGAWHPIYHLPLVDRENPIYNRFQMKNMNHQGISPHGHPAWRSRQQQHVLQVPSNSRPFNPHTPKNILSIPYI